MATRQETLWLKPPSCLSRTPTLQDRNISASDEQVLRAKGISFLQRIAISQKIPVTTCSTASTYFHRFYTLRSLDPAANSGTVHSGAGSGQATGMDSGSDAKMGIHHYPLAAAALFLACKTDGTCAKRTKDFVAAVVRIALKSEHMHVDAQSAAYWQWYDVLLAAEDLLLDTLGFELECSSPYFYLTRLLDRLGVRHGADRLRNRAWAFLNDSQSTMLCLIFPARTIAAGACWFAAGKCGVRFADVAVREAWWVREKVRYWELVKVVNFVAEAFKVLQQRGVVVDDGGCPYAVVGAEMKLEENDPTRTRKVGGEGEKEGAAVVAAATPNGHADTPGSMANGVEQLGSSPSQVGSGSAGPASIPS